MLLFGILFGSPAGGGGHAWRLSFGVSECNTIKIVGKGRWDVIHFLTRSTNTFLSRNYRTRYMLPPILGIFIVTCRLHSKRENRRRDCTDASNFHAIPFLKSNVLSGCAETLLRTITPRFAQSWSQLNLHPHPLLRQTKTSPH